MAIPPSPPVTQDQVALLVHDLRNPLAGVTAALQLLGMGLAPSEQEEIRTEAVWAANRLGRMITDLLLLHAAAQGGPIVERRPVALASVLDEAVRQAALCARLEGMSLEAELADGVTSGTDRALLQPLLDHLLVTAVRQSPPGAVVRVRLTREAAGPCVAVTVPPGEGAAAWRATLEETPKETPQDGRETVPAGAEASAWADRGWRGDLSSATRLMQLLAHWLGATVTAGGDAAGEMVVLLRLPTLSPDALPR